MERNCCLSHSGHKSHHTIRDLLILEKEIAYKKYSSVYWDKSALYDLLIFIIGAISKIVATLITYPYTLIRTKQHVNKT